jgi:hypothetical protein
MTKTPDHVVTNDPVLDALVLAAVERAERHRVLSIDGVPAWEVLEHLNIAKRSAAARRVKARIAVLVAEGALERSREHGIPLSKLTTAGRQRLQAARRRTLPELPESPQHRRWRQAQALAEQERERVHLSVEDLWEELDHLLVARVNPGPTSDAWFQIADRLARACWLLGSMSHCLHEWPEPDDEHLDRDDEQEPPDDDLPQRERQPVRTLRYGRRDIMRWKIEPLQQQDDASSETKGTVVDQVG